METCLFFNAIQLQNSFCDIAKITKKIRKLQDL